jgi:thiazole synthase ThiGH ThiG subunit
MQRSHDVVGAPSWWPWRSAAWTLASSGSALLASIEQGRFTAIATTTGCRTADEAIRTAYLARESGLGDFVKVDVLGDARTRCRT